ncbi:unnamed protein product [Phytophthora lilii]|uniref:Unnamed protein product n=1 Tax=Phytophthora lilii TaxID=2077276 RepID=A0A9W6WQB5_9STRA|nr:unnamed protein product [Phytophthora lilii]
MSIQLKLCSVPSVLVHLLAVGVVLPDNHVRVVRHRGHQRALRAERDPPHRRRVSRQRLLAVPVILILRPDADSVVVAGRHEQIFGRVPGHELDVLRVSVQHGDALEVGVGVGLPDPDALVATARGQVGSRGAPGHALDLALVSFKTGDDLVRAALLLPDDSGAVETHGRQVAAVRGPGIASQVAKPVSRPFSILRIGNRPYAPLAGSDGASLRVFQDADALPRATAGGSGPQSNGAVSAA